MTSGELATELEVARRTILRDIDALSEAGLPVVTFRGSEGGVELGFNYRARLTGLWADEAEALAVLLSQPSPELAALGLADAGARARDKVMEALPEAARTQAAAARLRFRFEVMTGDQPDPRLAALADAIRGERIVWAADGGASEQPRELHPVALAWGTEGWRLLDARVSVAPILVSDLAAIQVSAHRFR